jgi:alkylation response protein AidB-like acyl-CoA dehydrogenase
MANVSGTDGAAQFQLSAAQTAFCAEVRELASTTLRPLAEAGAPGRVNRPLVAALGSTGLLARLFPGQGAVAALDLCLLRESLAQVSTEAETALALQGLGTYPLVQSGTRTQVDRWLPSVVAGEAVAAFALSEPGSGSDAAALELAATPTGDGVGWTLTGAKTWISNAPEADFYTVFARTTPHAGARGVSAFLVPADRPGLKGTPLDMVSPHPIGSLEFDGVYVSTGDLLGPVDQGFRVAMQTLDLFRPSVGAFAVGMAQAALDASVAHAAQREAFGGTLRDLQSVSHAMAEMATRIEASRLLVYSAAAAYDAGEKRIAARAAMAKLFATETAQFVVDAAVQIHGARALQRGHLLEHLYREVRAPRIYEGASEVQRTIIGRELYRG